MNFSSYVKALLIIFIISEILNLYIVLSFLQNRENNILGFKVSKLFIYKSQLMSKILALRFLYKILKLFKEL